MMQIDKMAAREATRAARRKKPSFRLQGPSRLEEQVQVQSPPGRKSFLRDSDCPRARCLAALLHSLSLSIPPAILCPHHPPPTQRMAKNDHDMR